MLQTDLLTLHDTFDGGDEMIALPDDYFAAKYKKPIGETSLSEQTSLMEKFFNIYDPEFQIGAKYDMDNMYRRLDWHVIYESSFDVGRHLQCGILIMLNKENCVFENRFKIQCGERVILVKEPVKFMHMFDRDLNDLQICYEDHIVFEDMIGRVLYDLNNDSWLALYQIQNHFFHKIGIEDEPWRIVFSERELKALMKFMRHQMYVWQSNIEAMRLLTNSLMFDVMSKVRNELRVNCAGCCTGVIINHTCDDYFFDMEFARELLLKHLQAARDDKMNADRCRKHVLEKLERFVKPIATYIVKSMREEAAVTRRFYGGVPQWIKDFVTPQFSDMVQMFKGALNCDEVDN